MSAPVLPRRGFLRGLAALPLIGGGVTLIGQPTAAAVPVTDVLHERYLAWLAHEHWAAMKEHAWRGAYTHVKCKGGSEAEAATYAAETQEQASYIGFRPEAPDIALMVQSAAPSTRAAVILSAAGVPLTGGGA